MMSASSCKAFHKLFFSGFIFFQVFERFGAGGQGGGVCFHEMMVFREDAWKYKINETKYTPEVASS